MPPPPKKKNLNHSQQKDNISRVVGVYFLLGPKERRREASISLSVSNEWTSIKSYEDFGGAISSVIWSRVRQRRSQWKELCRRTVWCLSDGLGGILNQQRRPGIKLQETLRGKYSTAPHRSEHLDCFSSKNSKKKCEIRWRHKQIHVCITDEIYLYQL